MGMVADLMFCCMVDFISILAVYDILYIFRIASHIIIYVCAKIVDLEFLTCISSEEGTVN